MINSQFEEKMAAQCRIKVLKKKVEEFESGERYIKIQNDYHKVITGYIKEIDRLKKEVGRQHAQYISNRNMWIDDYYALYDESQKESGKLQERIIKLEGKIWETEMECDRKLASQKLDYEDKLHEKDCIIEELKNKLAHAEALLANDGTNTSMPTSQTPIDKKKRNPNSRKKTGRTKGGQVGHEKHSLEKPDEEDVTDVVDHRPGEEGFVCPDCESDDFTATGTYEEKYEYDVEIRVKKIKHVFYYYRCNDCGTVFGSKYPPNLRGEVQYGSELQAVALSLTNTVNSAMNKTAMFIAGMTGGELTPCEGYIAKLQSRAVKGLVGFMSDLKMLLITRRIVYWDDTVIKILTKNACMRFYGDETIAYYTAHEKKDMNSVDEDGVLSLLTSETYVMHDHNTLNYNKKFQFKNIECAQHLERDLQKNSDHSQHKWSTSAKKLLTRTIKDRNEAVSRGEPSFSDEYIEKFHADLSKCLVLGWEENGKDEKNYWAQDERALLRRIEEYRENYFAWVNDFTLPTTNNLSERSLRGVKSHMKISGQFESADAARHHATIRSYIETCRRNNINEIEALRRLCEGNPYTVAEIFSLSKGK